MNNENEINIEVGKYGTSYSRDASCDKHGPFRDLGYAHGAHNRGNEPSWLGCPTCSKERRAELEAKREAARKEEERLKRIEQRIERSGIPAGFAGATLDTYLAGNNGQRHALAVAKGYADDFHATWEQGRCLLLLGSIGTGKTHLAVGIARAAMDQGGSAIFTTMADMIGAVKATWGRRGDTTEEEVKARFASTSLLVLDEIGSIKCSGREQEILFAILNGRYNAMLPTLFTGNLKPEELRNFLGNQIVSRLRERGTERVVFDWDDYRPIKGRAMAMKVATAQMGVTQ